MCFLLHKGILNLTIRAPENWCMRSISIYYFIIVRAYLLGGPWIVPKSALFLWFCPPFHGWWPPLDPLRSRGKKGGGPLLPKRGRGLQKGGFVHEKIKEGESIDHLYLWHLRQLCTLRDQLPPLPLKILSSNLLGFLHATLGFLMCSMFPKYGS